MNAMNPGIGPLLSARNLTKTFGGITAVRDISFDLMPGEILGLIGPNGAGKTTCFNLITGFYAPSAGSVSYRGRDVTGQKPHAIARQGIVRSFQKTNVLKSLSVFENILAGHYLEGRQSLELANAIIFSSYAERAVTLPLDRGAYDALLAELRGT